MNSIIIGPYDKKFVVKIKFGPRVLWHQNRALPENWNRFRLSFATEIKGYFCDNEDEKNVKDEHDLIFSSFDLCGRSRIDWNEGEWRNGYGGRGLHFIPPHHFLFFVDFDAMVFTFAEFDAFYKCNEIIESVSYDFDELPPKFWSSVDTEISWKKTVKYSLTNCCLAFGSLSLSPYVLLEVFDWFPLMYQHVAQKRKIDWIFHIYNKQESTRSNKNAE